ncbi:MAG: penicillin-binding protein 1B, partial [Gammaproteobacteria bacterium]|nr:penicillin-binding protein 1B [Gammaproteobacteria bacterium]
AMWANITAGRWVQGGSTLTQQLIKNFYLTSARTLSRKFQEMIMALLLELHYDKDEILEAYLNEVYLGQTGNRAIHGFGLGSLFYFGRPLKELQLSELALLVGLIKGPSYYNPRVHPKRALERRNLVLTKMVEVDAVAESDYRQVRQAPLGVTARGSMTASQYPAYLDFVRRQLQQDYREEDLKSEGLRIFTTLDPYLQRGVEHAITERLEALERRGTIPSAALETAAIVVRSDSGEILALAGGRHARLAGFNRALDAQRPIGSLIKPVVYLTALEEPARYTLATLLDDAPLRVRQRGSPDWVPTNYDRQFHGRVLLVDALARSYNVSTARLGMELGVNRVVETLHRLGARREIASFPSVLLGATSVSPVEVAQIYLTLANNGFRAPLRSIRSVHTQRQQPLARYPLSIEQVVDPAPMALLHFALQEVVRRGTARGLTQRFPPELELAGKTGTTDEFRDSWFAGYSGDYMAVVWVGRDDNAPTGLTGASGAMQVWADIMQQLDLQPLIAPRPDDLEEALIDRQSGGYADNACSDTLRLPFVAGSVPAPASCARTVSSSSEPERKKNTIGGHSSEPERKKNTIGGWLKRLFEDADE